MLGCQLEGIDASKSCVEELSRGLESALVELDEFMKDKLIRPVRSGKVKETRELRFYFSAKLHWKVKVRVGFAG